MKKVMVFGVFDGLHKGHQFFLKEAKKLGDYLTVVLARDEVVEKIKQKIPRHKLKERVKHLEVEDCVDEAILGDKELDSWQIFEEREPDVIALGYDQFDLKKSLEGYFRGKDWCPEIIFLPPFKASQYKSSLINHSDKNKKG